MFPNFHISQHPELVEVLGLHPGMRVETYDAVQGRWDCHSLDTIQQVERNDVVLFRKLPNGIGGPRMKLDNCPGLHEEIETLVSTTFMINYRHLPAHRHPHCLMNL